MIQSATLTTEKKANWSQLSPSDHEADAVLPMARSPLRFGAGRRGACHMLQSLPLLLVFYMFQPQGNQFRQVYRSPLVKYVIFQDFVWQTLWIPWRNHFFREDSRGSWRVQAAPKTRGSFELRRATMTS